MVVNQHNVSITQILWEIPKKIVWSKKQILDLISLCNMVYKIIWSKTITNGLKPILSDIVSET